MGCEIAVEDILELRDGGRDFKAEVEDLALALEADILGPLDHARQVPSRLDVLADAEVAGLLLDQRVLIVRRSASVHSLGSATKVIVKNAETNLGGLL